MIEELSVSIQLNIPAATRVPDQGQFRPQQIPVNMIIGQQPQKILQERPRPQNSSKLNETPKSINIQNISKIEHVQPEDVSPITSSKKVRLNRLMGKLNKSLEDFFLKDGPEESSYVDDFSMLNHYNK